MTVTDRDRLAAALAEWMPAWTPAERADLIAAVDRIANERAAAALTEFADLVDRGPTFPLAPSIFSAMARERAGDLDS